MRFVTATPLVRDAQRRGYGVPALNTNGGTYDIARAAVEAAQELQAPLILQIYEPNAAYRGPAHFVRQADSLCRDLDVTVPVALQLDHGKSFEAVLKALNAGLTSVMFDASHEPIETNISKTNTILRLARMLGASLEAEVGHVPGNEAQGQPPVGRAPVPERPQGEVPRTNVPDVRRFVEEVEVDMLAVSVGTVHGVFEQQTDIDFHLLAALRDAVAVPLVAHGTCGISLDDLTALAKGGMAKINFGEPFRYNFIRYFTRLTDELAHSWHPWKIMREVRNLLKQDMKQIITALGAEGKAEGVRG